MDIFSTHYTYQREAVEGKKSFKILQAKQPCYKKYKLKSQGVSPLSSHCLLIQPGPRVIQWTVLLIFVTIISPE